MVVKTQKTKSDPSRCDTIRLSALFGVLYFAQGIAEPSEGLIAQPVRSMLADWSLSAASIGVFAWAMSLPWWLKPLYGFLSDFVPIAGLRRKSYLLLASGAASAGLLLLFWWQPQPGSLSRLLAWLLVPTVGVAMADVVVDALMVEKGQPLGLTGRLQSIQWSAMYAATIITGSLGGWLSEQKLQSWGFLICGVALLPTVALVLFIREPSSIAPRDSWRSESKSLFTSLRSPSLLAMCGFLLLWNLNPFSTSVLQLYMTSELAMTEQFYGHTVSLQAVAALVASVAYGFYCRRVPFPWLVHGSIVCGILATIGYWWMHDEPSAIVVSFLVGFAYMTGSLIQLDLAARTCPVTAAASVFALLMAVANVGLSLSHLFGGYLYDAGAIWWDRATSFRLLVGIGRTITTENLRKRL
jgi:MFS family permease